MRWVEDNAEFDGVLLAARTCVYVDSGRETTKHYVRGNLHAQARSSFLGVPPPSTLLVVLSPVNPYLP